jgi:hypothetical protein
MAEVPLKRSLLIGLVSVTGVALLAVAFLLGRTSGSGLPAGAASPERTTVVSGSEPRSAGEPPLLKDPGAPPADTLGTAPASSEAVPFLPGVRSGSPGTPAAAQPSTGTTPIEGEPPAATDPASAAVAKYLADVDQIQPANLSGSPESVAAEMATALARGDTSGLDAMIRQTEAAKERLAAVRPPAPCALHYEKSLESLDDAVEMLRALKSSMQSPDPVAGLASVQARAGILQTRAEALQNEDRALRQRYGLAR